MRSLHPGPVQTQDPRPAIGAAAAATAGAAVVAGALDQLSSAVDVLAGVDATTLPADCVTSTLRRLSRLDGRIDGIQARLVSAAEAVGLPERSGAPSTTAWVADTTGRNHHQAARASRLANTMQATPEVADAVADGTLGPDQASTVASGLDRGELEPADAQDLVRSASHLPPGSFSRESRRKAGRRRQQRLRRQELAAKDERYVTTWRTENGSLRFEGLVPPAEGDRVEKALSAFHEPDGKAVPDDQRRTHRQRMADAFTGIFDTVLTTGAAGAVGTVLPHISVLVPVEAMALLEDAEDAGVTAVTDLDTVMSAAEYKKLACDAVVRRVVLGPDSRPLDVGRATRRWSGAQRAAVTAVDGGCRGPSCDLPADRCVIHHITWWRNDGPTSVDNGLLLCGHAHDLIHDRGWAIQMDPATRVVTWTAPDGTEIVTHPRGPGARGRGASAHRLQETTQDTVHPDGDADPHGPPRPGRASGPARSAGSPRSHGPPGRGDPARPRGPDPDPSDAVDGTAQAPTSRRDATSLQLDL